MKDSDPMTLARAFHLADELLPDGFSLSFSLQQHRRVDNKVRNPIVLMGYDGRRRRTYTVVTMGELREAIRAYLEEVLPPEAPLTSGDAVR